MLRTVVRVTSRTFDRLIPNITASALNAIPNGCAPECGCGDTSHCHTFAGCTYTCINLACHLTYYCMSPIGPNPCVVDGPCLPE